MGVLRALGLGKDPHVEWMIEAFGAKPGENVVNRLYQGAPKLCRWEGDLRGTPLTFYTNPGNQFRGGSSVYLGKAGPQFMGEMGEYRCAFYHPRQKPSMTLDDPRFAEAARKAAGDPNWSESFPEEVFEIGLGMGRFAMEPDCPLDPQAGVSDTPLTARASGGDVRRGRKRLSLPSRRRHRVSSGFVNARKASVRRGPRRRDPSAVGIDGIARHGASPKSSIRGLYPQPRISPVASQWAQSAPSSEIARSS